ncbi:hypothetical protein HELRODRAFT_186013 [Helobdella robusta]|uniref:Armadillo-like helical domain-containing protein n=1 Tax=Helobdella robusta TaxID=6412 RepID=T1FNJ7_HELRO|nr:hypothetical protein HELRODRAFT_186013 [Helobdella robusta]ESN94986.1 hypothetical protein HELRODRAFT_186013 [Helobdella robusta]
MSANVMKTQQAPDKTSLSSSSSTTSSTSSLLRRGSQTKRILKEKVVQIYGLFFRNEDPSQGNPNFWDELFLLKANPQFIESEIEKLSGEQLIDLMLMLNKLFQKSVEASLQDNHIRINNAFQTICSLTRGVLTKCSSSSSTGFDLINILIGFESAEVVMKNLVERLNTILTCDFPHHLKSLSLAVLMTFVTGTDNVSQNTLLEYLMMNSLFEAIVKLIAHASSRHHHGNDAVQLLSLLVQYRKNELINPYIVKLSILDDEMALTGLAQIVSTSLSKYNNQYQQKMLDAETSGFFATISNLVGNMFVGEETKTEAIKANSSVLLALYEAIHLNRNFITTLAHSHTHSLPSTPTADQSCSTSDLDSPAVINTSARIIGTNNNMTTTTSAMTSSSTTTTTTANDDDNNPPTNLLATFLEYSSIICQDIKDTARYNSTKLCFIIITCIAEDQYANSLLHDNNMNFRVMLHRAPMRHRRPIATRKSASRPLVCALIDLMVEFIISHLMKNFPIELHLRCLGIIHRIICYQKKCRIRLNCQWRELWSALINLLKFILTNESTLVKKCDLFHLATKIVNIFNLFITYGDTFLNDPNNYDELYYEIIRTHQIFDNLYSLNLRYSSQEDNSYKDNHHVSSLTENEVLDIVRNNYDSLTLKMHDSLDQYERYSEKPKDITNFFMTIVRDIASDLRRSTSEYFNNTAKAKNHDTVSSGNNNNNNNNNNINCVFVVETSEANAKERE